MGEINFLLGMIGMQAVYLFCYFVLFRKQEFLYFLIFTIGVTLFVFVVKDPLINPFGHLIANKNRQPIGFGILFLCLGLYYRFTRFFIEAPVLHHFYNIVIKVAEFVAYAAGIALLLKVFLTGEIGFMETVAKLIFSLNLPVQLFLLVYLFRTRELFNYMLFFGSLFMSAFFKMGLIPIILNTNNNVDFRKELSIILFGMVVNFLFFNFMLIYKFRRSEKQKLQLDLQKAEALQIQRSEISNDLHDDLGSVLSSIQVYADMASKDFVTGGNKTERYLQKISSGIKMAMDNIGDVIWAVRNDQANEKSISSRIKDFFIDVFDARGIECTYEIDSESEDSITGILSRKYLLLILKEAINNAIKHSGANCIKVKLNTIGESLHLAVEDNGKGVDEKIISSGNAFSSLRNRTSKLGGSITIQNANGQGTLVECVFPITTIREK